MIYACCDEKRRRGRPRKSDAERHRLSRGAGSRRTRGKPAPADAARPLPEAGADEPDAGERADHRRREHHRDHAVWVAPATRPAAGGRARGGRLLRLRCRRRQRARRPHQRGGDFSPYILRLSTTPRRPLRIRSRSPRALDGFDPQLAEVTFSFKVECGPDFDCAPVTPACPPDLPTPPPINYLAKDYGSFRARHARPPAAAHAGLAGSEARPTSASCSPSSIAYVGDQLSYQQDAVATEAYLHTARSRISLRRHARLVDYRVRDGCNARAWIRLPSRRSSFSTARRRASTPTRPACLRASRSAPATRRPRSSPGSSCSSRCRTPTLYPEHNDSFYTWGDDELLPAARCDGGDAPRLDPNLAVGDVLIFQEVIGPQTGVAADADIRHRCAVRLTSVATTDGQGQPLVDPLFENGTGAPIRLRLADADAGHGDRMVGDDALPFPVCISSTFLEDDGRSDRSPTSASRMAMSCSPTRA